MASRETTLRAELASLDAAIAACLAAGTQFNWKVGHVSIDNTSKLKELYEQRDKLWSHLQKSCPTESVETVTHNTNQFGNEIVAEEL